MGGKIDEMRDAGFSDQEIGAFATQKRQDMESAGFAPNEIDGYFHGVTVPADPPKPFLDRLAVGAASAFAVGSKAQSAFSQSFSSEGQLGFSDENEKALRDYGIFRDPETGRAGPLRFMNEAVMRPTAAVVDALMRAPTALIAGAAAGAKEVGRQEGQSEQQGASMERELNLFGNFALQVGGADLPPDLSISRPTVDALGHVYDKPIGGAPRSETFSNAVKAIGGPQAPDVAAQKLLTLYTDHGFHPAEVAHDATSDPTIAQHILSDGPDLPYGIDRLAQSKAPELDAALAAEGIDPRNVAGDARDKTLNILAMDPKANPLDAYQRVVADMTRARIESEGLTHEETGEPGQEPSVERPVAGGEGEVGARPQPGGGPAGSVVSVRSEQSGVPQPATGGSGGGGEIPAGEYPLSGESGGGGSGGGGGNRGGGGTGGPLGIEGPERRLSDAEEKVLSRLSIGEEDPTRKMTLDRLYTHVMDHIFPLAKATKEAEAETGEKLPTSENPYQLARLISGVAGKAEHMLNHGMFDFESYENVGPSLKDILAPVKNDLNGFRAFATALHAAELEKRGIKTGVDMDAARQVVMQGNARYGDALLQAVEFNRGLARYLRDSGVLSEAGFDAMNEQIAFYVPFNRVMGDGIASGPKGAGASLQAQNPIHRQGGSERIIVDPIENIIRNTYLFTSMAEKNAVGTKLIDMLLGMGEISELRDVTPNLIPRLEGPANKQMVAFMEGEGLHAPADLLDAMDAEARGDGRGEITIFRDGKRETYMVDPDLARAFKGLDAPTIGLVERIMAPFASTLRAGATLSPTFAIKHLIRDYIYAFVTSKGVFTPADSARGFIGAIAKDEDYWKWMKGGGGHVSMVALDRRYMQEDLAKLTGQTGLMTRMWNVLDNPEASVAKKAAAAAGLPFQAINKFALSPLRMFTEWAESATHLGAFKRELRKAEQAGSVNKPEIQSAAFISRDTAVDAARRGASMRAWNMITAFSSITLQDSDRIVRAIKDNPGKTLLALTLGISLPSAILWMNHHDDPRYRDAPDWEKDPSWMFLTDKWVDRGDAGGLADRMPYDGGDGASYRISGGRIQRNDGYIFRLPKPFAAGIMFGSAIERAMSGVFEQNPHAFDHFANSLYGVVVPQFYPTMVAPMIDQWANRSLFTNRTLVPSAMEGKLPEMQYTPYTTELAKAMGRIVGSFPGMERAGVDPGFLGGSVARAISSPILLENYLRGWTGTLGSYALTLADAGLRQAGVLPDPPMPTRTLADIPFINAFMVRYPTASAQSIQDFQDRYAVNNAFYKTWLDLSRNGDRAYANAVQDAGGPLMFVRLNNIQEALVRQNQVIRDIYKNPTMPPDEKRQLIDSAYYGMIQIAHIGNQTMEQINAAARQNGTLH
jgi:hypothetical protein